MKRFKIVLVILAFAVNLLIAPPSWADPDLTATPDYVEVTQAIDALLNPKAAAPGAVKPKPEEIQQQLGDLKLQKYILETTKDWAQCRNETGKTLAVYAHKPKQPASANTLFYLANGQTTDDDWNCDGIYLPSGTDLAGKTLTEPQAIKVVAGTQLVAKTDPVTGTLALNIAPAKVFKAGEGDWSIPTLAQADIDAQKPNAPIED
jgi:hypothetical protein